MPTLINKAKALQLADTAAHAWYQANAAKIASGQKLGVLNTGPTDVFVTDATGDSLINDWKGRGDWNGLQHRASISSANSADQAIDLKLAQPGGGASCFNFHLLTGKDPVLVAKEKAIAAEAAKNKQMAADFKKKQADEAEKKKADDIAKAKTAAELKQQEEKKKAAMAREFNVAASKNPALKKSPAEKAKWEKSWSDDVIKRKRVFK